MNTKNFKENQKGKGDISFAINEMSPFEIQVFSGLNYTNWPFFIFPQASFFSKKDLHPF